MNLSELKPKEGHLTGPASFLTPREWQEVRAAVARGVTLPEIYKVVGRFKTIGSFRRCFEHRFGQVSEIRECE